jgi:hypothetical protein
MCRTKQNPQGDKKHVLHDRSKHLKQVWSQFPKKGRVLPHLPSHLVCHAGPILDSPNELFHVSNEKTLGISTE